MREIKKYKEVKVDCFKTGQNLYSEIFQNITEKQLEKELNKMAQAGWDRFDIDTDGKKRTLVLKNSRQKVVQTDRPKEKIRLDTRSEVNSAAETTGSDPGLNGIKKQKS